MSTPPSSSRNEGSIVSLLSFDGPGSSSQSRNDNGIRGGCRAGDEAVISTTTEGTSVEESQPNERFLHVIYLGGPSQQQSLGRNTEVPPNEEGNNREHGGFLFLHIGVLPPPFIHRDHRWQAHERTPFAHGMREARRRSMRHDFNPVDMKKCALCLEWITGKPYKLECGHWYDISCLKDMFQSNVDDERLFPPRCCNTTIPLQIVDNALAPHLKELYRRKIVEYSTPERLYCSNSDCRHFIGPRQFAAEPKVCPECETSTCARCTGPAHDLSRRCKPDKAMRAALLLGQKEGWQRCPGCRTLIMRNGGCLHISCRCDSNDVFNTPFTLIVTPLLLSHASTLSPTVELNLFVTDFHTSPCQLNDYSNISKGSYALIQIQHFCRGSSIDFKLPDPRYHLEPQQ
ncbi:IBR finger [Pyrrhoderma noxium]|uniref:IBR finger n=1 Tax=Pyrrhoderma noxium TaxID=2282107 RepID=A0A286UL59_9AGAM|nr:IBR finger [Pyrrhoderma noxium]